MARKAGLCWYNTPLPIRQVNLVPPNQPVHSPFVHFVPKELAVDESIAPTNSNDANEEETEPGVDVAQESSETPTQSGSSTSVVAAPFRMGPTPPLVRTVVPQGATQSMFPRGNVMNSVRTQADSNPGPNSYDHSQWNPLVSIYS